MAKKRNQHDDNLTRLATILRDALTAAWVKHNPDHTSPQSGNCSQVVSLSGLSLRDSMWRGELSRISLIDEPGSTSHESATATIRR